MPEIPGHPPSVHVTSGAIDGGCTNAAVPLSTQLPQNSPQTASSPTTTLPPDFFQAAVIGAGIPIVGLDAAGTIHFYNQAAVRIFGRSESETLGRSLDSLLPPDARPTAASAFQRTLQQRSVNVYEMAIVPVGGKHPLHVAVTLSCVINEQGAVRGVMAWFRDITNRKELEANLTRTRHMASVGTLAAGVAHHFNNIVCGMNTMVEFALATDDPGAMVKALKMSSEAASRISYITQSLLACTPQDTHCGRGTPDMADLTEQILRFADAVEPTLSAKGIALELDLQATRICPVPTARFGQVLQHLLRNAQDAIETRSADVLGAEKKIILRTQSQHDQIMLQFTDTGCGIEPEDLPQIFDPFFTKKGVQGGGNTNNPGLGLTIVHGTIIDLGGHIWADSIIGQGTTINILLPTNNQ